MTTHTTVPDETGRFGEFGGRYVPETLIAALDQLAAEYARAREDPVFQAEFDELLRVYVGRATPLTLAGRLTDEVGGARIYLKREDLAHTGAHKINNTIGQALLTRRMGKQRVIAETGAGQHGVATATACAHFGLRCEVYMGAEDVRRQSLNVFRMKLMGATVHVVESGSRTLKDATNEAMRDWMASVDDTHYILGSVVGPHPFPMLVRDFQSVIGTECREQCRTATGRDPDCIVACVGGGSNAAGIFYPFVATESVKLVGVEAGGRNQGYGEHAAPLCHGAHAWWKDTGRVEYTSVTDAEALDAFCKLAQLEGIIPALETSHAVAEAMTRAASMSRDETLIINVSGRGDKDVQEAARLLDNR